MRFLWRETGGTGLIWTFPVNPNCPPFGRVSPPRGYLSQTHFPNGMRELDEQESDNGIGEATGVNVRTVGRKRQKLEQAGILSYFTHLDLSSRGTGEFNTRHLYIIKFRLGVTYEQLLEDIQREPYVRSIFTEIIFESHISEIDGTLAMLLFVDGASDLDIVQTMHQKVIPSLRKNHGENSIEEVSTIRVLSPVRMMRNYVLPVNMADGYIRKDWPDEAIYVGKGAERVAKAEEEIS
jgi:hypothetical protein